MEERQKAYEIWIAQTNQNNHRKDLNMRRVVQKVYVKTKKIGGSKKDK